MDNTKIGSFITLLRKEHNMTQKELAEIMHVSPTAVNKWEKGVNIPDFFNLQTLAKLFEISIQELIDGEKNSKTEETLPVSEEISVKKKSISKKTRFFIILGICSSLLASIIGLCCYNHLLPRFTVVDSYYGEPTQDDVEVYGFDKAYWIIMEYSGNVDENYIINYKLNFYETPFSDIDLDNIDIIYIEYYSKYKKDSSPTYVTTIFLPLFETTEN